MLESYLEELKKTPLLQPEQEKALWQQAEAGDMQAHRRLMSAYQPLVFKVAMGFRLPEQETMELIQEGMIGLLEAGEKYDYHRGVAFSLFASFRIKGCMLDYLRKSSSNGIVSLESELSSGFTLGDTLVSSCASPAELAEKALLQEKVSSAMERLPEREQQILKEMYIEDRTARDIADTVNISLGHVYRLQKQGVRRIRGMLSRFMHDFNKV